MMRQHVTCMSYSLSAKYLDLGLTILWVHLCLWGPRITLHILHCWVPTDLGVSNVMLPHVSLSLSFYSVWNKSIFYFLATLRSLSSLHLEYEQPSCLSRLGPHLFCRLESSLFRECIVIVQKRHVGAV